MGRYLDDLYELVGLALSVLKNDIATQTTIATYKEIVGRRAPEGVRFYNKHREFDLYAFLAALSCESQLTPEEREARAKTWPTLQLVQAIMTAIDRTRAVMRNNTLFGCYAATVEEMIYENNLAHLCLAIEVLNWIGMKNDGNKTADKIFKAWVDFGCSRAFVSRFGVSICKFRAARGEESFEDALLSFVNKWANKDAEKCTGSVSHDGKQEWSLDRIYEDLEIAMGNDARTLDAIIRIANGSEVDDLWKRFPQVVNDVCCLVGDTRSIYTISANTWEFDKPAHVEKIDDVCELLRSFNNSRTRAIVHRIVDKGSCVNAGNAMNYAELNHYNALMSAVKNLLIAKTKNNE